VRINDVWSVAYAGVRQLRDQPLRRLGIASRHPIV